MLKIREKDVRIGRGSTVSGGSLQVSIFLSIPVCVRHIIRTRTAQVIPAHHHAAVQIGEVLVRDLSPIMLQAGIGRSH